MNKIKIDCSYDKMVPVAKLVPHPRNRNNHPENQLNRLAAIIQETAWRDAIVVSNQSGFIIAGHGRLAVANILGMEKVPVDYQDFENEAAELQHLVADNEIARWATFDESGFIEDLKDLKIPQRDLTFFGIQDIEKLQPKDLSDKNKEIDTDNFGNDLQHVCPKCSFEFSD